MRILVVGAGAVGGYYGARLVQAGRAVTFLLRGRRAQQVRKQGLRVQSPRGDVTVHPHVVTAAELPATGAFDLVLVSTKAYALAEAMEDFAPAVGPGTLVLPLLNGMAHLRVLEERFGAERVLGGTVRIMADVLPDGTVVQQNPLDQLAFGFRSAKDDGRGAAILEALTVYGFTTVHAPDILDTMWQKWWLLAAMGTACVLADGSLGEARRTEGGADFNRAVLDECMAVAAANGHAPRPELMAEMRARFDDPESPVTSSMYRDMKRGGAVEAEQILGDLLRHAGEVATPLLRAAFVRLQIYEARRTAAQA